MRNPLEHSPRLTRIFFTVLALVVLGVTTLNFLDIMFFKAVSNDQCGWLPRPDGLAGALITDVVPGGVTDRAGIKDGDILLRINEQEFRTPGQAMNIINPMAAGEYATYLVERSGVTFETKVEILKMVNVTYLAYCLIGVGFLLVGYVVVMTRPQGRLQRLFAWYSLAAMLVFGFTALNISQGVDPQWKVITFISAFFLGRLVAQPLFVHFFMSFPVRRPLADRWWFKGLLIVLSIAALVPIFTNKLSSLPPLLAQSLILTPFIFFFAGLVLFVVSYFTRIDPSKRRQFRPILVAIVLGVASFGYLLVIQAVNRFVVFTQPILLVPGLLLGAVPAAFGYSIFRYRLMDIDLIVKRSLLYGAITATLAAIYIGMVFGVGSLLGALIGERENEILNITAFLIIAFAFDPIKRRVQDGIDRVFYRERMNYQRALLEFSQELPRQMNLDQILHSMVNRISATMHVEKVAVLLCDEIEGCYSVGKNIPPECCDFGYDDDGFLDLLKRTRSAQNFGLLADEPEMYTMNSPDKRKIFRSGAVLSVPMFLQDRLVGTILVGPKLSEKPYSQEDIDLLSTVGSQAAIAIENARLHKAEIEQQRIREELALAREIQQGLLPKENPAIPGLDISGIAIPAKIVGGDYFDFIQLDEKRILVVVADVSGKGMSAALYMSKIQGMVQLAAHMYNSPREMLTHVNRRIYDGIERKSFITMIIALFDMDRKEVIICRAGHNKALIGSNGKLEALEAEGIGLGLERGPVFESTLKEVRRPLEPGGLFFFYTDGLTEAMNAQQVQLGEDSIVSLIEAKRSMSAAEIQRSLTTAVEEFVGTAERHDDLTMVVVKVKGEESVNRKS
ncbi:MAG: SpoIIE family protein phosphatase [Ignavibacteriales bacterium]|nr:SpoIIE family protein phosphatase [Ignavibacteriales bacterium]